MIPHLSDVLSASRLSEKNIHNELTLPWRESRDGHESPYSSGLICGLACILSLTGFDGNMVNDDEMMKFSKFNIVKSILKSILIRFQI